MLYRNPENRRLWMIGAFPSDYQNGKALRNVEVTTTDDQSQARIPALRQPRAVGPDQRASGLSKTP